MNEQKNMLLEDLLIVIVFYNTTIEESTSWRTLITSTDHPSTIFIYDNGPVAQQLPSTKHQVIYMHDLSNSGVAKAYNEGFTQCEKLGKHWLLLLDEDSVISPQLFSEYLKAVKTHPNEKFFVPKLIDNKGVVSPFHYNRGVSKRIKAVDGIHSFNDMRTANSCSLIHVSAFQQAGGYDLSLPLDFSDIYFQEKLAPLVSTFVVISESIKHRFSGSEFDDKAKAYARYEVFCKSCIVMASKTGNKSSFYWVSLKRALRLSFKFLSIKFIVQHIKTWMAG